jgi:hypothetical protein
MAKLFSGTWTVPWVIGCALALVLSGSVPAQAQKSPPETLPEAASPVVLDVTVLDSRGQPVVNGLNSDDFTVQQDGRAQTIRSFEAPKAAASHSQARSESGAPAIILVLDLLNSPFSDAGYLRA